MLKLTGKYNRATIYIDNIDQTTGSQIIELLNQEFCQDSQIRIMPDCHAGKGCVIGTTMTIHDKIVPNLVGVDIGCGLLCLNLGKLDLDFKPVDDFIRKQIPSGFNINKEPQTDYRDSIEKLICFREIPKSSREFNRALGTLGGGNHFIEVNEDKQGNKYLVIHSGSRNLGNQVANYYQKRAYDYHNGLNDNFEAEKEILIEAYKSAGKKKEIQGALKDLMNKHRRDCQIPKDLCYLEGKLMENYLHDMKIVQEYAKLNREIIARRIIEECLKLNYHAIDRFQTIHNYIDLDSMILRKGAISAQAGEKVLIPINMRDGSLIAIGKGNPEWNYSAPHGAGRLMSRGEAKENLNMEEYRKSMEHIYTSSVNESTLDEAPMAYKPIGDIINNISDTVEIIDTIRPLYNFKA